MKILHKICTKCGNNYPATYEYFSKNKNYKDGLWCYCKQCTTKMAKEFRDLNKEKLAKYKRDKRLENPEHERKLARERRLKNKEKWNTTRRLKYAESLKDNRKEYYLKKKHTPEQRFYDYKHASKSRNLEFLLTYEQFLDLTSLECFYCGRMEIGFSGIDRIDNFQDYTIENCVACCKQCNYAKHKYTKSEFFEMCLNVVKYNNLL